MTLQDRAWRTGAAAACAPLACGLLLAGLLVAGLTLEPKPAVAASTPPSAVAPAEHMTSEDVIERRLQQARSEVERVWEYKYALVNDVLDQATAEMRAIMLYERGVRDGVSSMAANCRTNASSPRLTAALQSFHVA